MANSNNKGFKPAARSNGLGLNHKQGGKAADSAEAASKHNAKAANNEDKKSGK